MQILHLAPDDQKFIPLAIDLFEEAFPGGNRFRIVKKLNGQFVKESSNTSVLPRNFRVDSNLMNELAECQILIAHSLRPSFVRVIEACRKKMLIVWSAWGFEYTSFLDEQLGHPLLAASRQFVNRRKRENIKTRIWRLTRELKARVLGRRDLSSIAPSIDVFSINPVEIPRLRLALPKLEGRRR